MKYRVSEFSVGGGLSPAVDANTMDRVRNIETSEDNPDITIRYGDTIILDTTHISMYTGKTMIVKNREAHYSTVTE